MKEREKNPVGKIFRFTNEELKFGTHRIKEGDALKPNKLYLCREILSVRERMAPNDSFGELKKSAVFMPVDFNGNVDESVKIEATTDWYHTEVQLNTDCVVGEIEIETKVIYKLVRKPTRFTLDHFVGRTLTTKESQTITDYLNSYSAPLGFDLFTNQELNAIFASSPLQFKEIENLGYMYDEEIVNDFINAKAKMTGRFSKFKDFFDFTVQDVQIENVKKMLCQRDFRAKELDDKRITDILGMNNMIYFDSFDGSIDDTAARDVYREMTERNPI